MVEEIIKTYEWECSYLNQRKMKELELEKSPGLKAGVIIETLVGRVPPSKIEVKCPGIIPINSRCKYNHQRLCQYIDD